MVASIQKGRSSKMTPPLGHLIGPRGQPGLLYRLLFLSPCLALWDSLFQVFCVDSRRDAMGLNNTRLFIYFDYGLDVSIYKD